MNDVLETGTQQTNSLVVDMVSDLICPWCFVAKRRVEKAAAFLENKVEIHWLPFELNADMPVDGLDRRGYRSAKFGSWEESQRLDARVAAAGAEVGIAFAMIGSSGRQTLFAVTFYLQQVSDKA